MKTASWSEMPGIVSTLLMRVGLLVKKSSSVFAVVSVILVGSVIIWSSKSLSPGLTFGLILWHWKHMAGQFLLPS